MGKRFVIGLLAVCLLSFCIQLALYPSLPETVPIHWNAEGEIDGWAGKWAALAMGALPFGLTLLLAAVPRLDPRAESYRKHRKVYNLLSAGFVLFFIGVAWVVMLSALDFNLPAAGLLSAGMGVLFILLGNFMPRIRPNYTFGIRLPWTLANETVWYKTHRVGGYGFIAVGIIFGVSGFFGAAGAAVGFGALMAMVAAVSVYAWAAYKKEVRKNGKK